MLTRHFLCDKNDIDELETKEFELQNQQGGEPTKVLLIRYEDQIKCFLNHCPHLGIPLNWQPNDFLSLEKTHIQCSTHGALFDPKDGVCISGPCNGDQLTSFNIECDEDNKIWIKVS